MIGRCLILLGFNAAAAHDQAAVNPTGFIETLAGEMRESGNAPYGSGQVPSAFTQQAQRRSSQAQVLGKGVTAQTSEQVARWVQGLEFGKLENALSSMSSINKFTAALETMKTDFCGAMFETLMFMLGKIEEESCGVAGPGGVSASGTASGFGIGGAGGAIVGGGLNITSALPPVATNAPQAGAGAAGPGKASFAQTGAGWTR